MQPVLDEQAVQATLYQQTGGEIRPGDTVRVTFYEVIGADIPDDLPGLAIEYVFVKVSGLGLRVVQHPATERDIVIALDPRDKMEKVE